MSPPNEGSLFAVSAAPEIMTVVINILTINRCTAASLPPFLYSATPKPGRTTMFNSVTRSRHCGPLNDPPSGGIITAS